MADIALKAQSLLVIQKRSVNPTSCDNHAAQSKPFARPSRIRSSAKVFEAQSSSFPMRKTPRKSSYRRSNSPPVMSVKTIPFTFTRMSWLFQFSNILSLANHACENALTGHTEYSPAYSSSVKPLPTYQQFVPTTSTITATVPRYHCPPTSALATIATGVSTINDIRPSL